VNISATLSPGVNLSSADMPVLSFWHRYALEINQDWGFVEVSTDGGTNWKTLYFVTGFSSGWKEEKVDLSEYVLLSDVRIRFRLKTNGSIQFDGWYIDDVCIQETATSPISYPFFDDMEDTSLTNANWHSSSWELVPVGHSGIFCWTDSPEGNFPIDFDYTSLTLANTIDLTTAANPQLIFWHHYRTYTSDHCYVEISTNNGHDWITKATFSGTQTTWIQSQVN